MNRVVLLAVAVVALLGAQASLAATVGAESAATGSVAVEEGAGPLVLDAGEVDGVSDAPGELLIETARGSAGGVAPDARYTYGDPGAPTATPAFTLTNAEATAHRLTLEYTGDDIEDADANVQFRVYDAEGRRLATATEESGPVAVDMAGHERVYVVVVIDTHGLTTASDLSGSLEMALT